MFESAFAKWQRQLSVEVNDTMFVYNNKKN